MTGGDGWISITPTHENFERQVSDVLIRYDALARTKGRAFNMNDGDDWIHITTTELHLLQARQTGNIAVYCLKA